MAVTSQPIRLIYCADGNPSFARAAVEAGWLYGARLPSTVYEKVYFADQDWKNPDRKKYMKALAQHRPVMATVLDWERLDQLSEVLDWAEEASQWVEESVIIIPKVSGKVGKLPRIVGGKRVVLGYSLPTKYGSTLCGIWEFKGWPVHFLGGSPHSQIRLAMFCPGLVSTDGNMMHQQAHKCRFWMPDRTYSNRWVQLSEIGDFRKEGANLQAFKLSLVNIKKAWEKWQETYRSRKLLFG